jgi:hypothetical protein
MPSFKKTAIGGKNKQSKIITILDIWISFFIIIVIVEQNYHTQGSIATAARFAHLAYR